MEFRELIRERGLHSATGFRKQELVERLTALSRTWVQQTVAELPDSLRDATDGGTLASGSLEIVNEGGLGFLHSASYLPGEEDAYASPSQIRRFRLRTGNLVVSVRRLCGKKERYNALLYVNTVDDVRATELRCVNFENIALVFPDKRIPLTISDRSPPALRTVDPITPIGKGQRGFAATPSKASKTTLLKEITKTVQKNALEIHPIVLLIDERSEEVTDIKEYIADPEAEVIYSTSNRGLEQYWGISEMAIERTRRITEQHGDVVILLNSITCPARVYNLTVTPPGRTFPGGLDPASFYIPRRFFGTARNMQEGGSLTILATVLVETGSHVGDVIYEGLKGTDNTGFMLDHRPVERCIFPVIDVARSETRREEPLLSVVEREGVAGLRNLRGGGTNEVQTEASLRLFRESAGNHALLGRLVDSK